MIILGLGSNLGNRLENLRRALNAIKEIPTLKLKQVSPVYLSDAQLPENAPATWHKTFFNCALSCECNLTPEELLSVLQKIELALGREKNRDEWSPRIIDIDILGWHSRVVQNSKLTIPHTKLLERPFALWPLTDVYPQWKIPNTNKTAEQEVEKWGSRYDGDAPFTTKQIYQRIDTPRIMGIVNVTPDSFSDGGKFDKIDSAIQQAFNLVDQGAEVLDFGAESTAPISQSVDPQEEWQRLEIILREVLADKSKFLLPPVISVDTRNAYVAEKALQLGVDWINDVTGLENADMRNVLKNANADVVVMHHMSIPPKRGLTIPRDQDPMDYLCKWSKKHIEFLEKEGIARERVIIDPGFGFGKSPGQAIAMFTHMHKFTQLGVRTLIGHSRKSFMASFTKYPAPERDIETLILSMHIAKHPVDYIRIHDVEMCARAFRVNGQLENATLSASLPLPC